METNVYIEELPIDGLKHLDSQSFLHVELGRTALKNTMLVSHSAKLFIPQRNSRITAKFLDLPCLIPLWWVSMGHFRSLKWHILYEGCYLCVQNCEYCCLVPSNVFITKFVIHSLIIVLFTVHSVTKNGFFSSVYHFHFWQWNTFKYYCMSLG